MQRFIGNALCPTLKTALFVLFQVVVLCLMVLPVQALDLSATDDRIDLTGHLHFAPGTAASVEEMLAKLEAGDFSPDVTLTQFEANHAPERWAAVELSVDASREGRILLDVPLASGVDLYLIRDGQSENILSYSLFHPFDATQHAATRLISNPVTLHPDEPTLLLAHVKFGPFQSLSMQFETTPATVTQTVTDTAWLSGFYAFGLAAVFLFLALFAALEDWIGLFYAALFLIGLLLMGFIDGLLFRFVYPDLPQIQSAVGFFLIFALAGSGFLLAAHGFGTGGNTRAANATRALAILCALAFLAALASPGPYIAALGNLLMAAMFVAVILGTRAWEAKRIATQRVGAWLGLIAGLAIAVLILLPLLGGAQSFLDVPATAKAVYLTLLMASLITFTAQVNIIRRDHNAAVDSEMAALNREVALNRELVETSQNYSHARDLAHMRRRQLASASHDLRQPLMSLRMTVDTIARDIDPDTRDRLSEAFDYIADLSGSYLDDATGPEDTEAPERTEEPYDLSMILQTVWQMFHEEAAAKGLRLRMVPSTLTTDVPPLVLMRITSNLVSNAIKYTRSGGVVFGIRRRQSHPVLTVSDTGPGMSAEDIETFKAEGIKGDQSEGHGLGIAVCHRLASEHELSLDLTSRPGTGTSAELTLPASIGGSTP